MNTEVSDIVADALAHLQIAANELEQAFLQAGIESPFMTFATRIDAVVRDIEAHSI
jgi:hypothetical protein